jgi:DNA-directed RNA polymerase sigma subunit (sigma70/sigma32)
MDSTFLEFVDSRNDFSTFEELDENCFLLLSIGKLPKLHGEIMIDYYGLNGREPLSSTIIAKNVGLTHQRISQIIRESLRKLKLIMGGNNFKSKVIC